MEFALAFNWSPTSYSSVSSRSSSTSSMGLGMPGCCGGSNGDLSDDVFGLKGLVNAFYAPELESELERLFVGADNSSSGGSSLGGRGSPDSLDSPRFQQPKSVWDDFKTNGQDCNLDDLDRLFLGMPTTGQREEHQQLMAATQSDGSLPPTPPPLSLIVDQLSGKGSLSPEGNPVHAQAVQEILTKAHLIDILREREQLQRAMRNVKRVIVTGGGGTNAGGGKSSSKSVNAKVCVFCRNNGEAESVYTSHQLKDPEGNVTCPILYIYTCPICGANGKQSHTIKYCPYNTGDVLSMKSLTKTPRNSTNKRVNIALI